MYPTVDVIAKKFKVPGLETVSWVQSSAFQSNGWVTLGSFLTSLSLHFLVYKKRECQNVAQVPEGIEPSMAAGLRY